MSVSAYSYICDYNYSGNQYLLLTEVSNVTSVSITNGEVDAITMDTDSYFNQIEIDKDTLRRDEIISGKRAISYDHNINFKISKPRIEVNEFTDSLKTASPCGICAIIVDNNSKAWLIGWNTIETHKRALYLKNYAFKNRTLLDANEVIYDLSCINESPDLILNSTLTDNLLNELSNPNPIQINFNRGIIYPGAGEISYPDEGVIIYP